MGKKAAPPKEPDAPDAKEQAPRLRPGQRERINYERTVEDVDAEEKGEPQAEPDCALCNDEGCAACDGSALLEIDPEPVKPLSPLETLLKNLQGSTDAVIYVIRKADPVMLRGKFRETCEIEQTKGQIPYEDTFTDPDSVALAVQGIFGGGVYKLQIRQNGLPLKTWTMTIADVPERKPAQPEVMPPEPPAKAVTIESELDELERTANRLHRLKSLMGWEAPPAANALPPAPAENSDPTLAAFLTLTEKNPTLAERFVDRFLPSEDKKSFVSDLLAHPQEALQLFQAAAMTVQSMFMRPNGAQPNGQAPAPLDPLQQTLAVVVNDLKHNRRVGRAVVTIEELLSSRPDLAPMFSQLLAAEPAALLAELSRFAGENLAEYEHAAEFISDLQDELRPDEDEGEGEAEEKGEGEE